MRNLIRLTDYSIGDIFEIFSIADEVANGGYRGFLDGKTVVMFFPGSSIRTRVTFEKGVYLLGGQVILFPPEALDKKERVEDVIGYLNNWADALIIRYGDIAMLDKVAAYARIPVINAMTSVNHPCEILSDLYSLSKIRADLTSDKYLFCGVNGNIGRTWCEAASVLGLSLAQCCPRGYELPCIETFDNLRDAVIGRDIICTDSIPASALKDFDGYQVTREILETANPGALLNPCPPFYRGEEASADAIDSSYFVGHSFKKHLLEIQQAIVIFNMTHTINDLAVKRL